MYKSLIIRKAVVIKNGFINEREEIIKNNNGKITKHNIVKRGKVGSKLKTIKDKKDSKSDRRIENFF